MPRRASTFLEVQIAMLIFVVGLSGLMPLAVINSRHMQAIVARLPANQVHYLIPAGDSWAAKLGAPAVVSAETPAPQTPVVELVDDGESGFEVNNPATCEWATVGSASAHGGSFRRSSPNPSGDSAIWSFESLAAGRYDIRVSYPASESNASNTQFHVWEGQTERAVVTVNQQTEPPESLYEGCRWNSLGIFLIQSGAVRVELPDGGDGFVAADAVRLVPVRNQLEVLSVNAWPEQARLEVGVTVTAP